MLRIPDDIYFISMGFTFIVLKYYQWVRGVVRIILLAFGARDPGSNPGGPV